MFEAGIDAAGEGEFQGGVGLIRFFRGCQRGPGGDLYGIRLTQSVVGQETQIINACGGLLIDVDPEALVVDDFDGNSRLIDLRLTYVFEVLSLQLDLGGGACLTAERKQTFQFRRGCAKRHAATETQPENHKTVDEPSGCHGQFPKLWQGWS